MTLQFRQILGGFLDLGWTSTPSGKTQKASQKFFMELEKRNVYKINFTVQGRILMRDSTRIYPQLDCTSWNKLSFEHIANLAKSYKLVANLFTISKCISTAQLKLTSTVSLSFRARVSPFLIAVTLDGTSFSTGCGIFCSWGCRISNGVGIIGSKGCRVSIGLEIFGSGSGEIPIGFGIFSVWKDAIFQDY